MRFPVPPFPTGAKGQSVMVINAEREVSVWLQNTSGGQVWLSEKQENVDTLDATGTPIVGFILAAGQFFVDNKFRGQLWARSNASGNWVDVRWNDTSDWALMYWFQQLCYWLFRR